MSADIDAWWLVASGGVEHALVRDAQALARDALRELRERWSHTVAVARRAEELSVTVAAGDAPVLVAAAWLHDIGYSRRARDTGFHPVDGARLLAANGWPARITGLVAHHSGASYVAGVMGLAEELRAFAHEESAVSDALAYADQTVGPIGERLSIQRRLADARRRHGPDSPQGRVRRAREADLLAVGERVERRLRERGEVTLTARSLQLSGSRTRTGH